MKLFVIQLLLLSCICEIIEVDIIKLDSIIYKALTNPKPHLWESLRENISDLYMNLDDIYEKIKQGDEEGTRIADLIVAHGGLHIRNFDQNTTVLADSFNITEDNVDEIKQAIRGTCHIWDCITRSSNRNTATKN